MKNKIESIQFLRFVAAFSVMMVHIPLIGRGIWGVDMFFVISGFIMMYITDIDDKFFFTKRIFRIVPLYWILTLLIFFLVWLKPGLFNNTTINFEHLFKSLFFIPFNKNETGHYPILFLGWTLNFEIIFYLLFGISILVFKKNKIYACSIFLISFYWINTLLSEKNFIFYAYSSVHFYEFIFGMIAYKIWLNFSDRIPKNMISNSIFLLIMILVTLFLNFSNFNLPICLHFGFPSFLLLLYFLFFFSSYKFPKITQDLGDASYCIYLIHPFIIQFFYRIAGIDKYGIFLESIMSILIIFIVLCVSFLIFKFIEKPLNNKLKSLVNV